MAATVRRRKEVEDPNNTWNMQLMAAVIAKDTKTADELLLKGAQIDHYAPLDMTSFAAGVSDIRVLLATPHTSLQPGGVYVNVPVGTGPGGAMVPADVASPATPAAPIAPTPVNAALSSTAAGNKAGGANSPTPVDNSRFLPNGVDPSSRHVTSITPFMAALLNDDIETATWVAAHGGNPNGQFNANRNGTVLHYLVRTDNAALLEAILAKRADIDTAMDINAKEAATRLTAVQLALHLRKPDMARVLIRFGAANPFTDLVDGRYTSTQYACLTGDVATVDTYLAAGDNIRQKDLNGQTLMHLALLQPAVMDLLIERGAGNYGGPEGASGGGGPLNGTMGAGSAAGGGTTSPTNANSPNARGAAHNTNNNNANGNGLNGTFGSGARLVDGLPVPAALSLNNAYNDDGETPLIFVIKHWSACGPGTGIIPGTIQAPPTHGNSSSSNSNSNNNNASAQGGSAQAAVAATAALLTAANGGGASPSSSQSLTANGLMASLPQGPIVNIPVVAAATGYNATIAAAIALATGSQQPSAVSTSAAAAALEGAAAGGADGTIPAPAVAKPEGGGKKGDKGANSNANASATFGYGLMRTALELVDVLVAKGADPSTVADKTFFGMTPLMHAIAAYAPDIIRRLVMDLKVDVNARDKTGATALHYAVAARMRGALDMLCLVEGIDLNPADRKGETPLHRAAIRGEAWAIQHLLAQSFTDVNAVDAKGFTALHSAVNESMRVSVEALLPRCCPPDAGAAPQLEKGKKATTLKKGQLPPEPPVPLRHNIEREEVANNWTALQLAMGQQKHDLAALLIRDGLAKVQRPFKDGSLLHEAVRQQSAPMVALLLEKGADVHSRNKEDQTALHVACGIPNTDLAIVELLLAANATVDDQDDLTLSTPLHLAVRQEHLPLVKLLISRKAKPNVANKDLAMPIHLACDGREEDIVNAVIDGKGARGTNVLKVTGMAGYEEFSRSDATFNQHSASGSGRFSDDDRVTLEELRTPIPIAQRDFANRTAIISELIAVGAQLRSNDTEGRLPLHRAAASGNIDAIAAILAAAERGREAMLLACDNKGWTPLHAAVALGGCAECVEFLLRYYEELPPNCFGVPPKAGPTVVVPGARQTAADFGTTTAAAAAAPAAAATTSFSNKPTSASAMALTARQPSNAPLTLQNDPVLALLRRQDNSNRPLLLLAAAMGNVSIGRFLVKYQKERTDGLKKGALMCKNARSSECVY